MLDEDAKLIQGAYWEFEEPWQKYRAKTGDLRNASECGDKDIRESAQRFLKLFDEFRQRHPAEQGMFWVIGSPSGRPELRQVRRPDSPSLPSAASG